MHFNNSNRQNGQCMLILMTHNKEGLARNECITLDFVFTEFIQQFTFSIAVISLHFWCSCHFYLQMGNASMANIIITTCTYFWICDAAAINIYFAHHFQKTCVRFPVLTKSHLKTGKGRSKWNERIRSMNLHAWFSCVIINILLLVFFISAHLFPENAVWELGKHRTNRASRNRSSVFIRKWSECT